VTGGDAWLLQLCASRSAVKPRTGGEECVICAVRLRKSHIVHSYIVTVTLLLSIQQHQQTREP